MLCLSHEAQVELFRDPKGMGILSDFSESQKDPNARKRAPPLCRGNAICFRRDLTVWLRKEQGGRAGGSCFYRMLCFTKSLVVLLLR